MANNINTRQNKKEMHQLIVTQHFTYREAKKYVLVLFLLSVVIPIIFNFISIWIQNNVLLGLISFLSIAVLIICEILRIKISKLKSIAASIQQKFDSYVFELKNNFAIDENEIIPYIEKYKNKDWQRKKNWYATNNSLNKDQSIFNCQCENIDWTNNLAKSYTFCLYVFMFIITALVVVNFIIINDSALHIISVVINILPFLTYCYSGFVKIRNDNQFLCEIRSYIVETETLLKNGHDITTNLINLQWLIYFFRQNKYLIPDWFDCLNHKKLESIEKRKIKSKKY